MFNITFMALITILSGTLFLGYFIFQKFKQHRHEKTLALKNKQLQENIKKRQEAEAFSEYIYKRAQELGRSHFISYLDQKNVTHGKNGKFQSKKKENQPNFQLVTD